MTGGHTFAAGGRERGPRGGREEVEDEVEVEREEGGPVFRHLLPATKKAYLCDTRRYW